MAVNEDGEMKMVCCALFEIQSDTLSDWWSSNRYPAQAATRLLSMVLCWQIVCVQMIWNKRGAGARYPVHCGMRLGFVRCSATGQERQRVVHSRDGGNPRNAARMSRWTSGRD